MDYRCPVCRVSLKRRKLSQTVIARMEMDCPQCKNRVQMNVHKVETFVFLSICAAFIVLAASAYRFRSQELMLLGLGVAALGAIALTWIDRVYLKDWPRYLLAPPRPGP